LGEQVIREDREVTFTLLVLLLLLVFLLILSSFFSGTETAFFSLSSFQISKMEEDKEPNAGIVRSLMQRWDLLLNGILLGNLVVNVLLTATATLLSFLIFATRGVSENVIFFLDILLVSFILLIFGEVIPKLLAIERAERIVPRIAPAVRLWVFLLGPVLRTMTAFSNYFGRLFYSEESSHAHTSEELKSLLDISAEGGDIEVETKDMISSIFEFGETRVKEIMVPRIDIVSIDIDTDVDGLLTLVQESEHSRIPVYEENIDQIRGIVYAKDLLNHVFLEGKKDEGITSLSKDAYFVPESKMIDDLLKELQRESVHMAIVVDEYGGTAGLVTMEDILEEIVGEIQDEYDVEEEMYQKLDENAYLVDGKLDIDDLSDLIGAEIEGEGFETVAGLIYQAIGRIPHQGEEVLVDDIRFIVSKVIGKRIAKIKVIRLPENQRGEEEDE
jgi:gliding motility-associated protein GldE